MEMQFFVKPGEELTWFEHWKAIRIKWHRGLGFNPEHYRFHDHDKLALMPMLLLISNLNSRLVSKNLKAFIHVLILT
jgi:hypothetical protein